MNKPAAIPHGIANFQHIRTCGMMYIDKTHFIPELEKAGNYLVFLRPRRSGKTLLISMLHHYYDINQKHMFDTLFHDTWIGAHPTTERNSYMILSFSLSSVNANPRYVEESFDNLIKKTVETFLDTYEAFFPELDQKLIMEPKTGESCLTNLLIYSGSKGYKIYCLIDEYDNFANTMLVDYGELAYSDIIHGAGVLRHFLRILKDGTVQKEGGIRRMMLTGVLPIVLSDVTSGFNIGTQISLDPKFAQMAGFTTRQVAELIGNYDLPGILNKTPEQVLDLMSEWYGGYRFALNQEDSLFNAGMAIYFMVDVVRYKMRPQSMVSDNVRHNFGKTGRLLHLDQNPELMAEMLGNILGSKGLAEIIQLDIPIEESVSNSRVISLLYFLGMLTCGGMRRGLPWLCIPNRTIEDQLYSFLRETYERTGVFNADSSRISGLIQDMAYEGIWEPFFDYLQMAVKMQTGVRDSFHFEKVVQGYLLAYLNFVALFRISSEAEMGKGYCDFILEPSRDIDSAMRFGYVVELKYIKRGDDSPARRTRCMEQARNQLEIYGKGISTEQRNGVTWKGLALVFCGWELVEKKEYILSPMP